MDSFVQVMTTDGVKMMFGVSMSPDIAVTRNGDFFTITHVHSGYAIAHFAKFEDAKSTSLIIEMAKIDFSWKSAADMPMETKTSIHKLFSQLCKSIEFHPGK